MVYKQAKKIAIVTITLFSLLKKKSFLVQHLANQKAGHILLAVLNTLNVTNSLWLH